MAAVRGGANVDTVSCVGELVPDAVHGQNVMRTQFPANVLDVRIDGTIERLCGRTTYRMEQLCTREDPSCVTREGGNDLELGRGQLDRYLAAGDAHARDVDDHVGHAETIRICAALLGPAKHRAHSRDELTRAERLGDNQLDVRGTQQWSATLGQLVLHTLAFDLADRLPQGMMILPGAAKPAAVRSINLAFEEIAAGPEAKVVVDARWETRHELIEVPIASLDSANVASGLSQALATLSDRIVAASTGR